MYYYTVHFYGIEEDFSFPLVRLRKIRKYNSLLFDIIETLFFSILFFFSFFFTEMPLSRDPI